uniref:ABM domain-containing protein n=1 Tax=Callorhinchus milii TaxID=7868 RepID=A0A4W3GFZ0_CALMI
MVVQRQMSVLEEEVEEFRQDLKRYVKSAANQSGSLHISVQKLRNESRFIVYEFWQDRASWRSHLQANHSKAFQRKNVDFLETPELMTTMLLPGKTPAHTRAPTPRPGPRTMRPFLSPSTPTATTPPSTRTCPCKIMLAFNIAPYHVVETSQSASQSVL